MLHGVGASPIANNPAAIANNSFPVIETTEAIWLVNSAMDVPSPSAVTLAISIGP